QPEVEGPAVLGRQPQLGAAAIGQKEIDGTSLRGLPRDPVIPPDDHARHALASGVPYLEMAEVSGGEPEGDGGAAHVLALRHEKAGDPHPHGEALLGGPGQSYRAVGACRRESNGNEPAVAVSFF